MKKHPQDAVVNSGGSLKDEVLRVLEDERRLKNMRFDEIYELIENNKSMQNELIEQKFNSQRALLSAQLMKENAERVSGDEMINIKVHKHDMFMKESQELLYQM